MKVETTNLPHYHSALQWLGFKHGRLRCKPVLETFTLPIGLRVFTIQNYHSLCFKCDQTWSTWKTLLSVYTSLFCWEYFNQKNISKTNFKYLTLCAQCFISWSCAQNPCNLPSIDRIRFGFALLRRKVNHYLTF